MKEISSVASTVNMRGILMILRQSQNKEDERPSIPLGVGDPSRFPCFRTTTIAEDAVVRALKAVAEYLSRDLSYKLSPDDVYITLGCNQAIEHILAVLARPNANILIPRPGFNAYEVYAALNHLEVRQFDLVPEKGWVVDLEAVEALADESTAAMVIINPGNPCGNVYTHEHLNKVAETARKLGIMVISDEVYAHLCFGPNPFVPMGTFASIVPVVTLGSISKRLLVPGWRLGWLVVNDPNNILRNTGVLEGLDFFTTMASEPATFIQGAVPEITEKTEDEFFSKTVELFRNTAEICYDRIREIHCFNCPYKPEGSMFIMVKLNLSLLEGIQDGRVVGLKNWQRITFVIEPSVLEDGLGRIKAFCQRHSKKLQNPTGYLKKPDISSINLLQYKSISP